MDLYKSGFLRMVAVKEGTGDESGCVTRFKYLCGDFFKPEYLENVKERL